MTHKVTDYGTEDINLDLESAHTLAYCGESAEIEYLMARRGGMADPVVRLCVGDLESSDAERLTVELRVKSRVELCREYAAKLPDVAKALRRAAASGHFTIVVAKPDSTTIVDRPIPPE
jgi:hypothetical protein